MSQNKANLDAWHVLRTVIDAGGFAQAAEQLQRSQSAVSYSVARLQQQLGIELLTTEGRRAVLTPQGSRLLQRGRSLLEQYDELMQVADELRLGNEPRLLVWVDSLCTTGFLLPILGEYQTRFPHSIVSITQGLAADLASNPPSPAPHLAITTRPIWATPPISLGAIRFMAVSHANHPLQGHDRELNPTELSGYRQVSLHKGEQVSPPHWQVTDVYQALGAVLSGQAYGWLPEKIVKDELTRGELLPLPLAEGSRYEVPVFLQYGERPVGKNGQLLIELIKRYFAGTRSIPHPAD